MILDHADAMVPADADLKSAVAAINQSAAKIALVVNGEGRLLGTITDGDVRRAILRGLDLAARVTEVMCTEPYTAARSDRPRKVAEQMRARNLKQAPLLDAEGRVTGIRTLRKGGGTDERPNWVMLFAGGLGQRLRPLTESTPKPMLPIGGRPILELILESFIEHGYRRFLVSVNYEAEQITRWFGDGRRWGVEIRYVHERWPLGTAGPLGVLPVDVRDPMLVMNGDVLTRVDFGNLLEFHEENEVNATMCVREYDLQVPFGTVDCENHRVMAIEEKPVKRFLVNAGIYVLSPEVVSMVPREQRLDMPDLFRMAVAADHEVAAFPIHEYWLDIGRLEDFHRAQVEVGEVFPCSRAG